MNTCLYQGEVVHRRIGEVEHTFRKRLYMVLIDLDEVDEALKAGHAWGAERAALTSFHRADHFGPADVPLPDAVRGLVAQRLGHAATGPIRLLTLFRSFGVGFNPVSFFYCYDAAGRELEAVVAEVSSTPWGERHCYVLSPKAADPSGDVHVPKNLHVSPFMGMAQRYRFQVGVPGEKLAVRIENREDDRLVFDATLAMRRRPWTARERRRVLLRHPAMSLEVIASIYLQAARLWSKRAPFHPHPGPRGRALERTS